MTLAHSISRFFLFIIYVTSVESWFATPTASGYHGTLVFNGLEQVWAGTDLGLEEHAYLGDSFQSLLLCDLRDVRIGLCDGFGSVCKTIRTVICSTSLLVVFVRCHFFVGCECVSLWFPKQWMINVIKYNNEALVYHNNIHGLHLNRGVDQQRKSCVTGLNLVTRQQQPQFTGWVTPSPTDYYEGVDDQRIPAHIKMNFLLKSKFQNCPRVFILASFFI